MDATGQNACEFSSGELDDQWQKFYGAMNEADWNEAGGKGGICGKCVVVKGVQGETTPGFSIKPVVVKIVDQCPGWACDQGNVDFSTTALEAITGYSWDKKAIVWDYIDCGLDPAEQARREAEEAARREAARLAAEAARRREAARQAAIARDVKANAAEIKKEAIDALAQVQAVAAIAAAVEPLKPEVAALVGVTSATSDEAQQAVDTVSAEALAALQQLAATAAAVPAPTTIPV